jgi:hypothetical protein
MTTARSRSKTIVTSRPFSPPLELGTSFPSESLIALSQRGFRLWDATHPHVFQMPSARGLKSYLSDWRVSTPNPGNPGQFLTAPSLSLLPHNQLRHRAHQCNFRLHRFPRKLKSRQVMPSTSARLADVLVQVTDAATVAASVRGSVRVLRSSENAA